ncbi:hypothetical protein Ahy_B10g105443 [Arachis hypogaea]|uniref:Zinc knuckle CX2CX4HX4C domain-containing protein n=1 Tax=Arachis hypogaea TaxID=3818 RepID=A0A444X7Z9_ARAHY|nr:hypothetical protein Ahy_B10g105443 [Arachis hypogaea]
MVGEAIGRVIESDLFVIRGKEERLLKIKVMLDITKPLKKSLKIACNNQKILEVNLKYEQIGNFYYYCGFVRHEIRNCQQNLEDTVAGQVKKEQWGPWLRAEQMGRRIEEEERKQTTRKPTPVNLICAFASLSVQEGNSQNRGIEVGCQQQNQIAEGDEGQEAVVDSRDMVEAEGEQQGTNQQWEVIAVYLATNEARRREQFQKILQLIQSGDSQLVVIGDFNAIRAYHEKEGGRCKSES